MRRVAALLLAGAVRSATAQASPDTACDSIIAAAEVDRVASGLFLAVHRVDGGALSEARAHRMALTIGGAFVSPKPFRLNVFAGPTVLRGLRTVQADTVGALRAPTLTGVYRVRVVSNEVPPTVVVIREAVMAGFDRAVLDAIDTAAASREAFALEAGDDSMRVDVVFSTDSLPGSVRLAAASFPRMRTIDATAKPDNPLPTYPAGVDPDSVKGPVIFRFVVSREGFPVAGTVEVLRAPAMELVAPALAALERQRFNPATIRGCPVAQQIDYPVVFVRAVP